MSDAVVHILRTGTANLASMVAAVERLGAAAQCIDSGAEVAQAPCLVVPGVGTFGATMQSLTDRVVVDALRARIHEGAPTLCVCVGLQILAAASDESPGAVGLEIVPCRVTRFGDNTRTPHFGWSYVRPHAASRFITPGHAYFANSYKIDAPPPGWTCAEARHGAPFIAAMELGRVLACQFHPELSGAWGAAIIARWLSEARRR